MGFVLIFAAAYYHQPIVCGGIRTEEREKEHRRDRKGSGRSEGEEERNKKEGGGSRGREKRGMREGEKGRERREREEGGEREWEYSGQGGRRRE